MEGTLLIIICALLLWERLENSQAIYRIVKRIRRRIKL